MEVAAGQYNGCPVAAGGVKGGLLDFLWVRKSIPSYPPVAAQVGENNGSFSYWANMP